jgi:hypothetical protein
MMMKKMIHISILSKVRNVSKYSEEEIVGEESEEFTEESEEFTEESDEEGESEDEEESRESEEYPINKQKQFFVSKPSPVLSSPLSDRRKKLIFVNNGDNYYIFGDLSKYINYIEGIYSGYSSEAPTVRKNIILAPPSGYDWGYRFGKYNHYARLYAKSLYSLVEFINNEESFIQANAEKFANNFEGLTAKEKEHYEFLMRILFKKIKDKDNSSGVDLPKNYKGIWKGMLSPKNKDPKEIGWTRKADEDRRDVFEKINSIRDPI